MRLLFYLWEKDPRGPADPYYICPFSSSLYQGGRNALRCLLNTQTRAAIGISSYFGIIILLCSRHEKNKEAAVLGRASDGVGTSPHIV